MRYIRFTSILNEDQSKYLFDFRSTFGVQPSPGISKSTTTNAVTKESDCSEDLDNLLPDTEDEHDSHHDPLYDSFSSYYDNDSDAYGDKQTPDIELKSSPD